MLSMCAASLRCTRLSGVQEIRQMTQQSLADYEAIASLPAPLPVPHHAQQERFGNCAHAFRNTAHLLRVVEAAVALV